MKIKKNIVIFTSICEYIIYSKVVPIKKTMFIKYQLISKKDTVTYNKKSRGKYFHNIQRK